MNKNVISFIGVGLLGLVVGLLLGLYAGGFFNTQLNGAGVNNQVQVFGTIYEASSGTVKFSDREEISTSAPFGDSRYSILVVGGKSYTVTITDWNERSWSFSLYVPTGVATFKHDF